MATHIFGIRHHGPGSAKRLVEALEIIKPDIILLEGPPEAEAILSWAANDMMTPPVAILAYVPDNPLNACFYPFTFFSPEWQAILYGLKNSVQLRFMDMPLTHRLAVTNDEEAETVEAPDNQPIADKPGQNKDSAGSFLRNPMSYLAEIAGFNDEEEWWEQHVELSREDPLLMFDTIKNAVKTLREEFPERELKADLQREVFMRRNIQAAQNEMFETIAVVCGAWHAPALEYKYTQKQEKELIRELPRTKVECTWIPWTNDRLMYANGYGAGIESPGWYEHQWNHPNDNGTLWLTKTAHVFRKQRMDISPAHVIESVRLAHALARIRNLHQAGLTEYTEATRTVMCMGETFPMKLLRHDLIIGNKIGSIPPDAPHSPLQIDFEKQLRSLRLKNSEGEQTITLDLRKQLDLKKSIFLYRLQILNINWGTKEKVSSKGTFKEQWNLYWTPEMLIALIARSSMGNTIDIAANTYLEMTIASENSLKVISDWLQLAIPAELPSATRILLDKMDTLAASASDISALIASLFPLSEVLKYGDVRRSDKGEVKAIFTSIFYRMLVGLPIGCTGINEEQEIKLVTDIKELNQMVLVLDEDEFSHDWYDVVKKICQNRQTAPLIAGFVHKLAYECGVLSSDETTQAFSQALSIGTDMADSAKWLEGFLSDTATILLLDNKIWLIVYEWVSRLDDDSFTIMLPLLRRTFSEYTSPEKDKLALKVKQGKANNGQTDKKTAIKTDIVTERALPLISTIEYLLGL